LDPVESDSSALAGLRVIIVEDESMLALCLSEVVEDEGCVVAGMAETVADARILVATATFDVAIIDLHLRGEQADDLAASIIRRGHAIIISTRLRRVQSSGRVSSMANFAQTFHRRRNILGHQGRCRNSSASSWRDKLVLGD
jgi:DNA-binding NarL/FixJ family response regulator